MKSEKLKGLQVRLAKKQAEYDVKSQEQNDLYKQCVILKGDIKQLEHQIGSLTTKELVMSEHAILRFYERKLELSRQQVEDEVLNMPDGMGCSIKEYHQQLGSGDYPIGKTGLRAVIKKNVVVTIK